MKFSFFQLKQERLVELGIGVKETIVLHWLIDWIFSGGMRTKTIDSH